MDLKEIEQLINLFPDFPLPGILFRDIHPIMRHVKARETIVNLLVERYKGKVDVVVGVESRGYYFGVLLAEALGVAFVPVRKPSKFPGPTESVEYGKEYGTDKLVVQINSITKDQRVVIIDDLMATGGTLGATVVLVQKVGGIVVDTHCLVELVELNGRAKLPEGITFHSFFQY